MREVKGSISPIKEATVGISGPLNSRVMGVALLSQSQSLSLLSRADESNIIRHCSIHTMITRPKVRTTPTVQMVSKTTHNDPHKTDEIWSLSAVSHYKLEGHSGQSLHICEMRRIRVAMSDTPIQKGRTKAPNFALYNADNREPRSLDCGTSKPFSRVSLLRGGGNMTQSNVDLDPRGDK